MSGNTAVTAANFAYVHAHPCNVGPQDATADEGWHLKPQIEIIETVRQLHPIRENSHLL